MALYEIGKGTYELPDNLDPEQLKNVAQQVYDKYEATRQTDLGYGVDLLQKNIGYGMEAIGDFTGIDALKNFGTAQAQRNEQSIEEGRWSPDQAGSFLDQKGVGNKLKWLGENMVTQGPNSGVALAGALAAMATTPFSVPAALVIGAGTTGVSLLQATGEAASETKDKTGSYDSTYAVGTGALVALLDRFGAGKVIPQDRLMKMTGDELVKELGEKGFTDAAQEVTKAITKAAGTEAVTEIAQESAIVAQSAAQGGQYTGEELVDRAVDSTVLGGSMGGTIRGATEILAQATSGSQEQKFDAMEESLEPIIQRGFNQGDEKGEADYNRAVQIMDSIKKAREGDTEAAKESLKFIDTSAANASFAQRLQKLIEGGYKGGEGTIPFDVQDVSRDSTTGARALVDAAHIDIAEGIRQKFSLLKDKFKVDTKKLESLQNLEAKIEASGALRHSKNKTKASLPADNFNAVAELVGNTLEGQELLNLMRESQVLTEVHNNDYVGGLSKYTDQLNPFGTSTGYSSSRDVATVARAAGTFAGFATGGVPALAAQGAIVAGGRKLGKGSRSNVANFIANNAGGQQMTTDPSPPLPSVVANAQQSIKDAEQAQQEAEQAKRDAEQAAETRRQQQEEADKQTARAENRGLTPEQRADRIPRGNTNPLAPTNEKSPHLTMFEATGLNDAGIAILHRAMFNNPNTDPQIKKAILDYRTTIDEGGKVENLTPLISQTLNMLRSPVGRSMLGPEHKNTLTSLPAYQNLGVSAPQNNLAPQNQSSNFDYQRSANYSRGVEANNSLQADLIKQLKDDKSVSVVHKAKLNTALVEFGGNLAPDPVTRINEILTQVSDDVPAELVQKYIAPYAERVMRQQGRKPVQDEVIEDRRPPMSVSLYQDPDQLWSVPEQAYDSADTSINSGKLPAGTTRMIKDGVFQEGQTVVDIGGGRFDNAVEAVGKTGATVVVYDPFNRTPEHNQEVASQVANGGADISMAHNVLNVIQEPENMDKVIRQAKNAIPIGGTAYFSVYEGTGKGKGFPTTKGYQRNEKTADYVPRIEAIFGEGNVERKGKLIIATNEGTGVRSRLTDGNIGRSLQRAQNNVIEDRPAPNLPLEINSKASLERAKEQGFKTDKVYYHGTWNKSNEPYTTLDPSQSKMGRTIGINRLGTWLESNPTGYALLEAEGSTEVYPVFVRGRSLTFKKQNENDVDPFQQLATRLEIETGVKFEGYLPEQNPAVDKYVDQLIDEGYSHITLIDTDADKAWVKDGKPRTWKIVLQPKDMRSVNAKFDPDKVDSPELIADRPAPSPLVDEKPSGRTVSIKGQTPNEGNKHGLMPHLRVSTNYKGDAKKPLVLQATNEKNAQGQMDNIDKILGKHKNPAKSLASWKKMMSFALSSDDIPVPPYNFINNSKTNADVKMLKGLSEQQLADANIGFENAKQFRELYTSGQVTPADTGKLFLWSFLSRGITPYVQESMFIDTFNGIDKFISDAALGTFNIDEYLVWADTNAPKGSGLPAAGAKANLNSFGKDFLTKMSKDVGDGRSKLEYLHDLMSDPNSTGKQIRREFAKIGEGVGIDNKVVSFTLLVAGYDDIMVLDRVQFKNLWDDGRFSDVNLYDGYKEQNQDGKSMVVTGSMLGGIGDGARGVLVYEALENSLQTRVDSIYKELGRPDDASIGRYHWETWVASSNQEASHGSLDAILGALKGDQNALADVTVKQGKLNQFAYGTRYGRDAKGNPFFLYEVPDHGSYIMDAENYGNFIANIKKRKYDIIPSGFKVSDMPETGALPWYNRPEVNKANLDKLAKQHGAELTYDNTIRQDDAENVADQTVSDRNTADRSQVGSIEGTETPILAQHSLRPTNLGYLPQYDENKPIKDIMQEPTKVSREKARSIITEISDEKPIRDMKSLTLLARTLNTDIVYVANQSQLDQVYKDYAVDEMDYKKPKYKSSSAAFFMPLKTVESLDIPSKSWSQNKEQKEQGLKEVFGKAGLCVIKTGEEISSMRPELVKSAFHEVSHSLTLLNPDEGVSSKGRIWSDEPANPINKKRLADDKVYMNTFQSFFYETLTNKDNKKLAKKLIDEVKATQLRLDFNTDVFPEVKVPYRTIAENQAIMREVPIELGKRKKLQKEVNSEYADWSRRYARYNRLPDSFLDADREGEFGPSKLDFIWEQDRIIDRKRDEILYGKTKGSYAETSDFDSLKKDTKVFREFVQDYLHTLSESIVDSTMFSITDPKQAKKDIPEFYKLLQEYFNSKDGIKFFSFVLPLLFMLNMEDEEERNALMAGALSPQGQGALAAMV